MSFVEDVNRAVSRAEAQVQRLGFSVVAEFYPAPMENALKEAEGRIGLSMPTVLLLWWSHRPDIFIAEWYLKTSTALSKRRSLFWTPQRRRPPLHSSIYTMVCTLPFRKRAELSRWILNISRGGTNSHL